MEIISVEEHEDGGATYTFDISQEEKDLLVPSGIQLALLCGITGLTYNAIVKICMDYIGEDTDGK